MIRPRSRRRAAITVLAVALVGAVVGLAVTGTGEPASAFRLLTGDAWLDNASAGTVSHVSGYTGRADTQTAVGRPGDPFEVVQRADGAYVLDLRTGKLLRLGDSTLSVVTHRGRDRYPGRPSGSRRHQHDLGRRPLVGDRPAGEPIDPDAHRQADSSRRPNRRRPGRRHRLALGAADRTGLGRRGRLPTARSAGRPFGHPGDLVQMADTSTGVWGVDRGGGQGGSSAGPRIARRCRCRRRPPARPRWWDRRPPAPTWSSSRAPRSWTSTPRSPSLSSLALPAAARASQVAISQGRAYLLDPTARQLETVDLSPLQALPPVTVPPGSTQLVSKDNLVFVNSPDSPQALVVNSDGAVTDIAKYVPATPAGPGRHGPGSSRGRCAAGSDQATAPRALQGLRLEYRSAPARRLPGRPPNGTTGAEHRITRTGGFHGDHQPATRPGDHPAADGAGPCRRSPRSAPATG